jgi:hypothetical protein
VVDWLRARGLPASQPSCFVQSLFIRLGELAREDEHSSGSLPPENYETNGGLNETARVYLDRIDWFDGTTKGLDVVEAHRTTLAS